MKEVSKGMSSAYTPRAGDIGLTQVSGEVGRLIRLGQRLNGSGFENYEHAFVVTDDTGPNGKPMIVEAEPGGAQYVELHYSGVYWCTGLSHGMTNETREAVAQAACGYIGVKYSFLDYASLAARRLELPGSGLVEHYVESTGSLICSQLAARTYFDAHWAIFDGWTGNVTPGDLYKADVLARAKLAL